MKNLLNTILTVVVILLLTVSLSSAHGADDSRGSQDHNSMMNGNHMSDFSEHMVVEGSIEVKHAIILNLNVSPSEEMQEMMEDHMGSGHMGDQHMMDNDYSNQVQVEFYELTEFEDITSNGYSSDDTIVSNYLLSNVTLNQPERVNDTYIITSKDNSTFKMVVDLKFDDQLFHGLKWSVVINHQFQSNSSELAMLHTIMTREGSMMERHQMNHENMHEQSYMNYDENHMDDNNEHIPMSFNWATTAIIDGEVQPVIATSEDNIFALSLPQGTSIEYDPEISADVSDIRSLDNQLSSLSNSMRSFADTISSPTFIGIFLGFTSLSLLMLVAVYIRRK